MTFDRALLTDSDARTLIGRLNEELKAMYPEEGATHFRLDPDEVAPGRGAFLVARDGGGRALVCGAVRLVEAGRAEVKRMFTLPEARGHGLAGRLLAELEAIARQLGAREMVLETGVRQAEALRLYERAG